MTYEDARTQLAYVPDVSNPLDAAPAAVAVGGMGGSALAGDALSFLGTAPRVTVHRDYGLPDAPGDTLYLAISYSGNTEETLSFANEALSAGKRLAVVTSGGVLGALAKEHDLPHVLVPSGYAPRNGLVYMVRAALALLKEEAILEALAAAPIDPDAAEKAALAESAAFAGRIPLFYGSRETEGLCRLAKLTFNETARCPAFMNIFPELNHNEMQSFDTDMAPEFSDTFRFFIIKDPKDDPRTAKRMEVFAALMEERGRAVRTVTLPPNRPEAFAVSWYRFLLMTRKMAEARAVDPDAAPLVEEFKKRL